MKATKTPISSVLAMCVLGIAGQSCAATRYEVIETRRLIVRDEANQIRGELGTSNGEMELRLRDTKGREVVCITGADSGSGLVLRSGKTLVEIGASGAVAAISVRDSSGVYRLVLGTRGGQTILEVRSANGELLLEVPVSSAEGHEAVRPSAEGAP